MKKKIYTLRIIHLLLVVIFLCSIGTLYYYGITEKFSSILYFSSVVLFLEAAVLVLNKGDCPFAYAHKKAGDEKDFLNIFFPEAIVPRVIPFVAVIAAVGFLLLLFPVSLNFF